MSAGIARERVTTLLFYGTVLLLGYLLYLLFRPFLTPLAWAAILAAFFHGPTNRWNGCWGKIGGRRRQHRGRDVRHHRPRPAGHDGVRRTGARPRSARSIFPCRRKASGDCNASGPGRRPSGSARISRNLEDVVKQGTTWMAGLVAGQAGAFLRNVVVLIVDLVVTLFAVFFFFRDGDAIMAAVRRALPFEAEQSEQMIARRASSFRPASPRA